MAADERKAWQPALRETALTRFGKDWGDAIEQGFAMKRTFERLAGDLRDMVAQGSRQTLVMPDPLIQQWWVAFQEQQGNMIPREPDLPPEMPHVDEVVLGDR